MNVNDPAGYEKRLPREEDRIENHENICDRDREQIKRWKRHRKANYNNKTHTLADHLKYLRLTAVRAHVPLVRMTEDDHNRFITEELEEARGLSTGTINNYKSTHRPFFAWFGEEWARNITMPATGQTPPTSEELLDMEEINDILNQGDSRSKALAASYADTGWRLSAIASLTVGDVTLEGDLARIYINDEGPVKGAEGGTPLSFGRGYLSRWLDEHDRSDDNDAPLWLKYQHISDDEDGALSTSQIRRIIYEMAEEAGIDRDRMTVHLMRHSAVKRAKRAGISERIAKKRFKWSDNSNMYDRYGDETDDEEIESQAVEMGLIDRSELDKSSMAAGDDTKDCPICETELPITARHCHRCGQPLTGEAAEEIAGDAPNVQDPEDTADDLKQMDGVLSEMDTAAVIEELIKSNPELLDDIDLDS